MSWFGRSENACRPKWTKIQNSEKVAGQSRARSRQGTREPLFQSCIRAACQILAWLWLVALTGRSERDGFASMRQQCPYEAAISERDACLTPCASGPRCVRWRPSQLCQQAHIFPLGSDRIAPAEPCRSTWVPVGRTGGSIGTRWAPRGFTIGPIWDQ